MVHSGVAALISSVGGKVEHIPYVRSPDVRVPREKFQHIFVVNRLIIFGVVKSFGFGCVQIRHAFRAVFGIPDGSFGIKHMKEFQPYVV